MAASTPPMSPGKRILRVVGSPGRYVKTKMRTGSQPSSVFSLVVCCLGSGMLTIPYTFYANGFVLGTVFIVSGGILSTFTGYLMADASHRTNGTSYEEIALARLGPKWQKFTSICMIPTNMGFAITYFVLFKSFVPYTFGMLGVDLPVWCNDTRWGQSFWAGVFFVSVIFDHSYIRQNPLLICLTASHYLVSLEILAIILIKSLLKVLI